VTAYTVRIFAKNAVGYGNPASVTPSRPAGGTAGKTGKTGKTGRNLTPGRSGEP